MNQPDASIDHAWFDDQVSKYQAQHQLYKDYKVVLEKVLKQATQTIAPHAIVEARTKEIPSFAEKILRKWKEKQDRAYQPTDLCGARVIVHTKAEVEKVCSFIRTHFEIDEKNSQDSAVLLKASEFGYRSVHYIVQFRSGQFPTEAVPVELPPGVIGLKAEVQVRT